MKSRVFSILVLSLLFVFAEVSLGQAYQGLEGTEAEEEEGTLAPLAPLGEEEEGFKFQEREGLEEESGEVRRPEYIPEAPTGDIYPVTVEALKGGAGEALVNQQVLLKVYFGKRGSLEAKRYGLKGKYHHFTVRNRNLDVLGRVWIPEGKEEILGKLRRGTQITILARVHDVTTLLREPVLDVSDIRRGWNWRAEDFLLGGEEVVAAPSPTPPTEGAPSEEALPPGVLAIGSRPGGADLFINGEDKGKTWEGGLRDFELPPGAYIIALHKDGYHSFRFRYELEPEQRREIRPELELLREEAPPVARTITVPNVVGLSLEVAQNVLGEAGFRGAEAGTALTTDPGQVNNVVSQSPVGETQAPSGSDVSLVIGHSEGPPSQTPPSRKVMVPDVVGKSLEDAQAALGEAGLDAKVVGHQDTSDPALQDQVVHQAPPGGTELPRGNHVNLRLYRIAAAPPFQTPPSRKVMVPDVVGKSLEDAQVALGQAGLDAKVVGHQDTPDPALQDQVMHQAPPGGTELPEGNHVNLRLYRFATAQLVDVHRWFHPRSGDHFYTTDPSGELASRSGYTSEGIGFKLWRSEVGDSTQLYRWFNPGTGDHFYTTDPTGELAPQSGYQAEGVLAWILKSEAPGTVPLRRWFHPGSGDHFYTTDPSGELAPRSGYTNEGVTGYVMPGGGAAPRPEPTLLPVPNVQNDPLEVAKGKLREAGLEAKVVGNQGTRDAALKDRVAVQAPGAGARVSRGSVVDLTLYSLITPPPRESPPGLSWTPGASMPTPRFSPHAATIDGLLYVVGGHDGRADTPVLEAYNPSTATWKSLASLPRAGSGNLGRYGGVIGVINDKIYLVGGWRISPPLPTGTLHIYDPKANSWTRGASIPVPSSRLSACSAGGVIGGKLYVLTACNGHSGFFKFFHVYDPGQNRWTQLRDAPNIHADAAAGVIGGKLYVAGGGIWGNPSATLDVYDPGTNNWTTKTSMPTARNGMAGGVIDGKLYVAGGADKNNNRLNTVEVYDPTSDTWTTHPSMPTARSAVTAAVINDQLYVVGGHDGTRPVGGMEILGRPGVVLPRVPGRLR